MAQAQEGTPPHAPETDDVQQSLELLDRVLLEFEDPCRTSDSAAGVVTEPPPPPEEAARVISALMPRGSPRGSPGHSLRRSPLNSGGILLSPSQTSAGTQTTLPKARHIGSKKLSSRFGSLPFDLSSHAAPQCPPPWLAHRREPNELQTSWLEQKRDNTGVCNLSGGARNMLHLPIQNPLTTSLGATPHSSSGSENEEEQFSDDSLEGQVSSDFDREADLRDLGSSTSREELNPSVPPSTNADEIDQARQRGSIAWDIPLDWDLDLAASDSKKRCKEDISKGVSRSQPQTPSCPPPPLPTSLSGGGTYVIREKKKRAALEDAFLYIPVIPLSSTFTSGFSQHDMKSTSVALTRGASLPALQSTQKQPSQSGKPVPEIKNCVVSEKISTEKSKAAQDICLKEDQLSCKTENTIVNVLEITEDALVINVNDKNHVSENVPDSPHENSIFTPSDINMKCNNIESHSPVENSMPKSTTILDSNTNAKLSENNIINSIEDCSVPNELQAENEASKIVSEMSFKIMRPKKIRPHSMPASEDNVVVFKSTVQLEPCRENKRPLSVPTNEKEYTNEKLIKEIKQDTLKNKEEQYKDTELADKTSIEAQQNSISKENKVEDETHILVLDSIISSNEMESQPISLALKETRPKSAYIATSSEPQVLKTRPTSCSEVSFNSVFSVTDVNTPSEAAIPLPLPNLPANDSLPEDVQISDIDENDPLPYNVKSDVQNVPDASTQDPEPSSVPIIAQVLHTTKMEENKVTEGLADSAISPPPTSLELETDENFLSEMSDEIVVPITVNSQVQTDITLGRRHRLSIDSPSEEQVVPSLVYRSSTLLTPDEPPLDKTLSVVILTAANVDEKGVGTDENMRNCQVIDNVTEPDKRKSQELELSNHETIQSSEKDEESTLITTVIIETKDDLCKKEEWDSINNFSPIKRPTDLFCGGSSGLETKLSRDSQRRKSHGSSLEMTTRVTDNRRSAPESSFLFPQGHYTIPLSFAVTNKPPNRVLEEPVKENKKLVEEPRLQTTEPEPIPKSTDEPTYKSVHKKQKPTANGIAKRHCDEQPPAPPPHKNNIPLEDEYAEPRNIPDFGSKARVKQNSKPSRPRHLVTHKEQQPPPRPPHQTEMFEAEKPLPPTPQTPVQNTKLCIVDDFDCHPLPPSPHSPKPIRTLPMSATFPIPPSPVSLHKTSKSQHITPSPHATRRKLTPPSPSLPRGPYPLPASSPMQGIMDAGCSRGGPRRPLPSPPDDYGFATREPGTTGLGSLKTRSVDAGLGRGLREQLATSISQAREVGGDRRTLPMELSGATPRRHAPPQHSTGLRQGKKKGRAPTVPPHASLPETPVFTRGCDIPRAPYKPPAVGIPVLRSSLSEEGDRLVLCGPARGWYPKQRQNKAARSTENLDQASSLWGEPRKPQTLPPNLQPPKFFHRSPREALRRVTSLLIRRGSSSKEPRTSKEVVSPNGASGSQCDTPQRQKRSFFRNFWKKSKHYSLEQ